MDDYIGRHGVSAFLDNMGHPMLADIVMDKKRFPSAQPVDKAYLCDWFINSVGGEPTWTEEHVLELVNDFYVIPKEKR